MPGQENNKDKHLETLPLNDQEACLLSTEIHDSLTRFYQITQAKFARVSLLKAYMHKEGSSMRPVHLYAQLPPPPPPLLLFLPPSLYIHISLSSLPLYITYTKFRTDSSLVTTSSTGSRKLNTPPGSSLASIVTVAMPEPYTTISPVMETKRGQT